MWKRWSIEVLKFKMCTFKNIVRNFSAQHIIDNKHALNDGVNNFTIDLAKSLHFRSWGKGMLDPIQKDLYYSTSVSYKCNRVIF